MPTVSIVIIGDEILKGTFQEVNAGWLIERFREVGAQVLRVAVVPDVVQEIADEVRRASGASDWVVTTGGVGPTHDDVTHEAIASAFDVDLLLHEGFAELMRGWGLEDGQALQQMATMAEGTEFMVSEGSRFPVLRCRNVFVLPGVPSLVREKMKAVLPLLKGERPVRATLRIEGHETAHAPMIHELARKSTSVAIGSYPRREEGQSFVLLTFEAMTEAAVERSLKVASELFPAAGAPQWLDA
jgi:molybdenum cofactor synthesis domain-containing protein